MRYVLGKTDAGTQQQIFSSLSRPSIIDQLKLVHHDLSEREIDSDFAVSRRMIKFKPAGAAADGTFSNPRDVASYTIVRSELS